MMDQATLRELFHYDPDTGKFYWKKRTAMCVKVGAEAGAITKAKGKTRYLLSVNGRRFYASRAAYVYTYGDLPPNSLVDHINGDTSDDRIANLRTADTAQNVWNRMQRSGAKYKMGVSRLPRGRFRSAIQPTKSKTKIHLGTWDTEEEAHAAYMGAAAVLYAEFWIGARPKPEARQIARAKEVKGIRE